MEFIVLIGPPCSGKSTYSQQECFQHHVVLSMDAILLEQHPDLSYHEAYSQAYQSPDFKKVKAMQKIFNERLFSALADGKNILIDKTNLTSKVRQRVLASVPKSYKKIAVIFDWKYEILLTRNLARTVEGKFIPLRAFEDMLKKYEPIKREEQFDEVITVPLFL